jgi:hypothetical protein
MYCRIVLPFFFQYLTNAENLTSSWSVTSNPTLIIPNNFVCMWTWPLPWSSGQSSWLQIQRSGFDFRLYQIFWQVVSLERVPLGAVSTIEELLDGNSRGSGLEIRDYGHRDSSRWPRGTLYPQKLAITSPTSGGRSVGIVLSRTQATEYFYRNYQLFSDAINSSEYIAAIGDWWIMNWKGRGRRWPSPIGDRISSCSW